MRDQSSTSASEELVVLLDEDGRAVGAAPKSTVHHRATPLHLAFSAYLFSPAGELLLTRRAEAKPTFPGVWTNSVCGHPGPGERLDDAVRRRARSELGLAVSGLRLVLPGFRYRAEMDGVVENELCPVYLGFVETGSRVAPDPAEVDRAEWVDWGEFTQEVLAGRREVSAWCLEQVRQLCVLGPEAARWPTASPALLPPAAHRRSATAFPESPEG